MTTSLVRTRLATSDDVHAVLALHRRCSPQTLEHRFHVPVSRVPEHLVRALVSPPRGWSIVAEQGSEVIGHGCAGETSSHRVEVGLLVDDAYQGTGVGTRLMRDLAVSAAERGYDSLVCAVEPDNMSVLPTVHRAGLEAVSTYVDGVVELEIPLLTHHARAQRTA
jgi:ribosomal protein S18 acetylase RimI-like enzyme